MFCHPQTLLMFPIVLDPRRCEARVKANEATIGCVSTADREKTLEINRTTVEMRPTNTVEQSEKAIASNGTF